MEGNAHMLQEEVFSGFVVISILFALALNIIWFVVVVVLIEKLPLYFYRNPLLTCFRAGKANAGPGLLTEAASCRLCTQANATERLSGPPGNRRRSKPEMLDDAKEGKLPGGGSLQTGS